MTKRLSILLSSLLLACSLSATAEGTDAPGVGRPALRGAARGHRLMTPQERLNHRRAMRSADTPAERQALRRQMHQQMLERAKEKGVTLPDKPGAPMDAAPPQ